MERLEREVVVYIDDKAARTAAGEAPEAGGECRRERRQTVNLTGEAPRLPAEGRISRSVLTWLNTFPDIPEDVREGNPAGPIHYEFLTDNAPCMALSAIQAPSITRRYILGGYEAEYQFKVIYRVIPGGAGADQRLGADELLERLGDWARREKPDLGSAIRVLRVETAARACKSAGNENGGEDHQILMKITYEVI